MTEKSRNSGTEGSTPKNIQYLRENGPTRYSDLPGHQLSTPDRMRGAARVHLKSRASGPGYRSGGQHDPVAYLMDEHDPRDVIEEYHDANPGIVEGTNQSGLTQYWGNVGSEFGKVAKEMVSELDIDNPQGSKND